MSTNKPTRRMIGFVELSRIRGFAMSDTKEAIEARKNALDSLEVLRSIDNAQVNWGDLLMDFLIVAHSTGVRPNEVLRDFGRACMQMFGVSNRYHSHNTVPGAGRGGDDGEAQ